MRRRGCRVGRVRTLDLPASFRLPNGTTWSPCAEPGELPQVEGMVVDPATGTRYTGQEDVGIWRIRVPVGLLEQGQTLGIGGQPITAVAGVGARRALTATHAHPRATATHGLPNCSTSAAYPPAP